MLPKRVLVLTLLASIFVIAPSTSQAQTKIPKVMNFQGYLTDSSGTPINGTKNLRFYLYDAVSGGNALNWIETHSNVTITNGIYNVMLGNSGTTPYSLKETFRKQYYLEIRVDHTGSGGWETMAPRHPLANAAYALAARKVVYQQVLTVASDGGDTTTVSGAIDLLMNGLPFQGPAYSALSPAPSASTPWVIEVKAGRFSEPGTYHSGFSSGTIVVPSYVTIRGQGWNATELYNVYSIIMSGAGQGLESLRVTANDSFAGINLSGSSYACVREVKIDQEHAPPAIDMSTANFCEVIENYIAAWGPMSATGMITSGMTNSRIEDNVVDLVYVFAAMNTGSAGITDAGVAMSNSTILDNTVIYRSTGAAGGSYGIGVSGSGTNVKVSGNVFQQGSVVKDIIDVGTGVFPAWTAPGSGEHGTDNQHSDGTAVPGF